MENEQKSPTQTIREALAAMKSCIQSGEPWTEEMENKAMRPALNAVEAPVEDGWRNCVGYLSEAPSQTSYVSGVPERTGADVLWRELTIVRQRGMTGGEPDTRVQMLDRFMPMEGQVIDGVERLMRKGTEARWVTRLVVQALLYDPAKALKDAE